MKRARFDAVQTTESAPDASGFYKVSLTDLRQKNLLSATARLHIQGQIFDLGLKDLNMFR